jgi:hypothetical protein
MRFDDLYKKFAIVLDGKVGSIVMICANPAGRKVAEDLFPDVEWTTDEKFSHHTRPDWLFTHIRVTRLPPNLEATVPLKFATVESLSYAVALALRDRAWPLQVAWLSGEGLDVTVNAFSGSPSDYKKNVSDRALYGDYVPAGTPVEI